MVIKKAMYVHVLYIVSLHYGYDKILRFLQDIGFSSIGNEEDVILDLCSEMKKRNMETFDG